MQLTQQRTFAPTEPAPARTATLDCLSMDEWQAYVDAHPQSTPFHHRNWIETIQEHYGLRLYIPCLKNGGQIEAAVPFLAGRSAFGATKLVALPFTDCLRCLGRNPEAVNALAASLVADPPPCRSMILRTDTALPHVVSSANSVRHEVTLPATLAELSKKFKPSAQRNLHKARRLGLVFEKRHDADALRAFFRLHVLTRRKLGIPVQPRRFFDRLLQRVIERGLGYVGLVSKAGRPIAAGLFLTFNNTVTYKYAASHPAALADRPNDWLVFNALRAALDEGYRFFDFGISGRNQAGLQRFKLNWGAQQSDVHTVQFVGDPKPLVEDSVIFKLTASVIRNSPPVVCRSLGEVLYRYAF
jgi:CelD/BcsL family acetyltransferase involved in cellulose biosynthesis